MKSDEELAKLAQQGDSQAEIELVSRYKNLLTKISRSYFLIGGEIEDLIQEGMIGLIKAIKSFKNDKKVSFSAYAVLLIKHEMQTAIKRASNQKNMVLSTALPLTASSKFDDEDEESIEIIIPSPDPLPDEILISKENVQEMKEAIKKKLSKMEFKVLKSYLSGQSYKILSEKTGLSEKSIDNALTRIKKKLEFLKK